MRSSFLAVLAIVAAAAAHGGACLPVVGEHIRARDLARGIPEFTVVPPETPISYTPPPGSERVFHAADVKRLALRFGINPASPVDVCFAIPMRTLQPEELIAAMRANAGFEKSSIEIVEFSRFAVPSGDVQFPRQGLGIASEASVGALWSGYVDYGANRHFAIWARARIAVPMDTVVAVEELREGHPIEAAQVRLKESAGSPPQMAMAHDLAQVIGLVPRHSIARDSAIALNLLIEPNDINRGDMVKVEVRSGAARLAFTGRAETAGRMGQRISIRNPQSGKTFAALVAAKGKAVVTASGEN